jgi:hypothetical protein
MIELSNTFVFRHIVGRDRFFCGMCYECAFNAGLFVLRSRYVSLCARCVLDRINKVDLELGGLPEDIETLRREAIQEVHYQQRQEQMALSVDWNYLWRCHRCKHLMQRYEVRLMPAEEGAPVTHHKICYACYLVYCEEEKTRTGTSPLERAAQRKPGDPGGLTQVKVSWK